MTESPAPYQPADSYQVGGDHYQAMPMTRMSSATT